MSYPIDPDVDLVEDAPHHPGAAHEPGPRSRWPHIAPSVAGLVFAGGCLGGYARYAVTTAWTSPVAAFPWSTLLVNTIGAFLLGAVVVVAARGSRWLRPLAGTGFCGGLTTFSALAVSADRLAAHNRPGTAAAYVVASTVAGLAAAWTGFRVGGPLAGGR